jgi:hypothetical protein
VSLLRASFLTSVSPLFCPRMVGLRPLMVSALTRLLPPFVTPILAGIVSAFLTRIMADLAPILSDILTPLMAGIPASVLPRILTRILSALLADVLPAILTHVAAIFAAILAHLPAMLPPILPCVLAKLAPDDAAGDIPNGPVPIAALVDYHAGNNRHVRRGHQDGGGADNVEIRAARETIAAFPADLTPSAIAGDGIHCDTAGQYVDHRVSRARTCADIEICFHDRWSRTGDAA